MTKTVDFYFTVLSPYTYLALPRLAEIARRRGAAIAFKPMEACPAHNGRWRRS